MFTTAIEGVPPEEEGFEKEYTKSKNSIYMLNDVCPSIEIIHILWNIYKRDIEKSIVDYVM